MPEITGIGIAVYDILLLLKSFPQEDTKYQASEMLSQPGGPVSSALFTAAKLGSSAAYLGLMAEDYYGKMILNDFKKNNIQTESIRTIAGGTTTCSYVLINQERMTRTCIWTKGNIPSPSPDDIDLKNLCSSKILLLDGHHFEASYFAAKKIHESGGIVLLDSGKMHDGMEKLLPLADIMIPSESFALNFTGKDNAEDAAKELFCLFHPRIIVVTQGAEGGLIYDGKNIIRYPAFHVSVIDTNGAGDVFHGAFAAGILNGWNFYQCAVFSSAVSALKCRRLGTHSGVPDFESIMQFLKSNHEEDLF